MEGHGEIEAIVSAHSSFAAYVPLLLMLTHLVEVGGRVSPYLLRAIAVAYRLRVAGMQLTIRLPIVLAMLNAYVFVTATLVR